MQASAAPLRLNGRYAGVDDPWHQSIGGRYRPVRPRRTDRTDEAEESIKAAVCDRTKTLERFNGTMVWFVQGVIRSLEIGGLQDTSCFAWVHLAYSGTLRLPSIRRSPI